MPPSEFFMVIYIKDNVQYFFFTESTNGQGPLTLLFNQSGIEVKVVPITFQPPYAIIEQLPKL